MNFHTALFPDSRILTIQRYPDRPLDIPQEGMEGKVLTGIFELAGHRFMALDGGPIFELNPSISFFVHIESKKEITRVWEALSSGGEALMPLSEYPFSPWYGWVQDRFGLSWQLILAEGALEQRIVPSLMFVGERAGQAEQAIRFYSGVFPDSAIGDISRYGPGQEPEVAGTAAYASFQLAGQQFVAMDSSQQHDFDFTGAISLYVECQDQEEVDRYWEALSSVPEAEQCGWLKDKYGVSWQIIPKQLGELLEDPDQKKSDRVMDAMLKMKKIDIDRLEEAYRG